MNDRSRTTVVSTQSHPKPTFTPVRNSLLQRKCACGGTPGPTGECAECRKKRLQRHSTKQNESSTVPPIVHDVLQTPGQPLDSTTRAFMEPRFGHDFSQVRIHTDAQAASSAQAVDALAYTVGRDIVFGSGQYIPRTRDGQRLVAHELTHVVQQGGNYRASTRPQQQIEALAGGGYRIAVAPTVAEEPQPLERQADAIADRVLGDTLVTYAPSEQRALDTSDLQALIQRVRVPLPRSTPLCGKTLTHIDLEPPRWRPLEPCLPPTVLVNRINIVGRDLSVPGPGRGRQVFNLHIGYYRDPATGRLCVIADDSKTCVAPRCLSLGCFLTLREVFDAIIEFLKKALVVLGIIALAIIIALIIELLGPILVPAAVLAAVAAGPGPEGGGELASSARLGATG
jgi:hypothetical protein